MQRAYKSIVFMCCLFPFVAVAAWPKIPFPENSRVESIGEQVRLNGVPMRMFQAHLQGDLDQVIRFYRAQLGPKLAEEHLPGGERILAQGSGDYFITLRIRPLADKTSLALISISDARAAKAAANRPLGFGLPADSSVLSDLESTDAGKRSRQLVFYNHYDLETNRQSIARELLARGYRPDRIPDQRKQDSAVMYFQGDKREARLSLVRKDGQTQAVLITIWTP